VAITPLESLVRLGVAVALGGAVGFERERSGHTAGLRTHLLVSLASATFMLVSTQCVYFQGYGADDLARVDGSRIASSVVVGIGFLGGGVILHSGLTVKGLTTAASLWVVAAAGLAAGGGMYLVGAAATGITLVSLVVVRRMEATQEHRLRGRLVVVLEGGAERSREVAGLLRRLGAIVEEVGVEHSVKGALSRVSLDAQLRDEEVLSLVLSALQGLPGVRRVKAERVG
jgi:putative Mg2+ transporter-C (MgtC) family protein